MDTPKATLPSRDIALPASYNYVGAFLTFRCPYRCSYCINKHGTPHLTGKELNGQQWIGFFERLECRDVPITLQGGEPGAHPDFIEIVRETTRTHRVDILSNLAFDLDEFVRCITPEMLNRPAPYAPIRVSYHPEQFSLPKIVDRILFLQNRGFRVGLYGVTHPVQMKEIEKAAAVCKDLEIDFRTKPFLGMYQGRLHGDYSYPEAVAGNVSGECDCATSELLIAPNGAIHRCHHYLYSQLPALASITDASIHLSDDYLPCPHFGHCNPCDIKVKNNRFQQFGHVSTKIKNIRIASTTPVPTP